MKIHMATSSQYKVQIANNALAKHGIIIEQLDLDTPEIQEFTSEPVAKYSAKWAAEETGQPVIKNDVGLYIEGLNGFPGPFLKFVEKWFSDDDWRHLLQTLENRSCYWIDALGYCEPGKDPVCFVSKTPGRIKKDLENVKKTEFGFMDGIFIPDGYDKCISEMTETEALELWNNDRYDQLAEHIKKSVGKMSSRTCPDLSGQK